MTELANTTAEASYAHRLQRLQTARWKQIFDVQAPYRWHIRRLNLGYVLDVGCGIGRNLVHLRGNGVGVDHNAQAVAVAKARGLNAFTSTEWDASPPASDATFDAMLLAHVAEHMSESDAAALVRRYLPFVKPKGRIVFITPQEKGYASDETHVRFVGSEDIARLCSMIGIRLEMQRSFPLPRAAGRFFKYNEFVAVARLSN